MTNNTGHSPIDSEKWLFRKESRLYIKYYRLAEKSLANEDYGGAIEHFQDALISVGLLEQKCSYPRCKDSFQKTINKIKAMQLKCYVGLFNESHTDEERKNIHSKMMEIVGGSLNQMDNLKVDEILKCFPYS